MNGKVLAGGVLVLLVVVGGIFLLIGSLNDAGSNTDDPGDTGDSGSLPAACATLASGACAPVT
jgi:hypothetical protein